MSAVRDLTPEVHRPPRDESMIADVGSMIDRYYGINTVTSDVQLLWNMSNSLAHGEGWYPTLTAGPRRVPVAEILTTRSFDAVCGGLNVTGLRTLTLAAARAIRAEENCPNPLAGDGSDRAGSAVFARGRPTGVRRCQRKRFARRLARPPS